MALKTVGAGFCLSDATLVSPPKTWATGIGYSYFASWALFCRSLVLADLQCKGCAWVCMYDW
jgi:hypothetical protein